MDRWQPLLRTRATDPAIVRHCIQERVPLLASGLVDHWPARSWSFDSLRARVGGLPVEVLCELPRKSGVLKGRHERTMRFSDFLDAALDDDRAPCYLAYKRAAELLRGYESELDFPSITGDRGPTDTRLWIGSSNTCSGLHSDLKDNVFLQVRGRKRVFLVPFADSHLVYPFPDNLVNSQVEPERVDWDRFPRFRRARVLECIVAPGDLLFIPRGWWHYLRSETPSISVNHWFGPPIASRTYLSLLLRLGPRAVSRTLLDLVRYSLLGREYVRSFFFSPASTGERLFDWLRHGDFSRENDPAGP
jgi:lysine-specific demethylase 8